MRHDPVVCPKCGAEFDAEAVVKTRRARAQAASETALGPIVAEEVDPELVAAIASEDEVPDALPPDSDVETEGDEEGDADAETEGEQADEEEEVIEDASELGEDEDDMAEVIENVDEEEER